MALKRLKLPTKAPIAKDDGIIDTPIEKLPSNTPLPTKFMPLHPAFNTKSDVYASAAHKAKNIEGPVYNVDLLAGTCKCIRGGPWQWHVKNEMWVRNIACSHKIRAMADIVDKAGRPPAMQAAYAKEVCSRYNMFEVVSAFHKELRRRSVDQAVFWGTMLANFRGVRGVIKYMLNIIYEETRDHVLAGWLAKIMIGPPNAEMDYGLMRTGIALFCASKKKWELPSHFDFLMEEMRGYEMLVNEFGRDVAKGGNIIDDKHKKKLIEALKTGLRDGDRMTTQYGLKGLQKLKTGDIDAHRAWIINELCSDKAIIAKVDKKHLGMLMDQISKRALNKLGIGYHELNNLVDFLLGEPFGAGLLQPPAFNAVLRAPAPSLRLGVAPTIPVYAHDNHTWAGKALLRRYPAEWQPGATQEHYDLRLCGAYMGVNWRHLAFNQFGTIECNWEDVRWPEWLHETVSNLWY
jgi:hypothetical protein